MHTRLLNAVHQRIPNGLYTTSDLRLWFRRLGELQGDLQDMEPQTWAYRLLLDVMDALSRGAPSAPVRLDRLQGFGSEGMRDEKVAALRGHVPDSPPVLVTDGWEVVDGRHRVTAARQDGLRTIEAVRV